MRQKLANLETENLVTSSMEFFLQLRHTGFILMTFKQVLNSPLNECLLITATVIFFFAVLEGLTLLLPVELKINVPCSCSDGMVWIDQLDY